MCVFMVTKIYFLIAGRIIRLMVNADFFPQSLCLFIGFLIFISTKLKLSPLNLFIISINFYKK
jgi:hypothetical protein